jgi:hypothetical protein
MIEFKVYSHYRAGSNVLEKMVEKCFDRLVHSETLGNKHEGFNKKVFDMWNYNGLHRLKLLICIKNPYAWVVSFSKWQIRDGFFTDEGVKPLSEITPDTIVRWCESFNWLYKHWINLPYEKEIVRYENLVCRPRKTLDVIKERWNLKYRIVPTRIENVVNPGGHMMTRKFDPTYYFENRFMLELSPEQIDTVRDKIDWATIGYDPEPPQYKFIPEYNI